MLEFKQAFQQNHFITNKDIPLIMQCKNIDFGHCKWPQCLSTHNRPGPLYVTVPLYTTVDLMEHVIDNILNINTYNNNNSNRDTLFCILCVYSTNSIIEYAINNGYLNNTSFDDVCNNYIWYYNDNDLLYKFDIFVKYLTNVSFNKFPGYYNLEKYYYITHMLLLITKSQKILPSTIIKHIIIPLIYQ